MHAVTAETTDHLTVS